MTEPDNDQKSERGWLTQWVPGIVLWIVIGAILVHTFMPRYVRHGPLGPLALCGANLNGVAKGIIIYQWDHDDLPPPNLAALVADGQPAEIFKCPSTDTKKAATTQPADIAAHCDYIYAPPPVDMEEGKTLLMAFELPANHRQDIVNVLFNDYYVKRIEEMDRFVSLVQELNDYHAKLRRAKP